MNLEILIQWTENRKQRIGFSDEFHCELCRKQGDAITFPIQGSGEKEEISLCKECLEKLLKNYKMLEFNAISLQSFENPRKLNIS